MKKENKKSLLIGLLVLMLIPSLAFGNDDFVVPFFNMLVQWMEGNVGMVIALIIMIISVIILLNCL